MKFWPQPSMTWPHGLANGYDDEDAQLLGARLVAEHAGVVDADRAVRRLDLRVEEGAFLEVQRAVRAPREGVDRVVAVLGAEAVQDDAPLVGAVVAVGVLQEHQVRLLRDVDAAVAEGEAGRDVEPIGEDLDLVGAAVAVGVLEDDQLVVRRLVRTDVRIGGRGQHPQPSARVEGHRQRVGQLGELALRGEQRHLVAVRRLEPRQRDGGILRGEVERRRRGSAPCAAVSVRPPRRPAPARGAPPPPRAGSSRLSLGDWSGPGARSAGPARRSARRAASSRRGSSPTRTG